MFSGTISGFTGFPGIVVAGVRSGKPGMNLQQYCLSFHLSQKTFHELVHKKGEGRGSELLAELLKYRKVRNVIKVDLLLRVHDLSKFHRIPVTFIQVLFQEKKN
jgi:hypothetical protein